MTQHNLNVPGDVIDAVGRMRRPVVIAHVVPDADALGAMLAAARALSSEDCKPLAALPDGSVSRRLTFMCEMAGVGVANGDDFANADGFIVADTAKLSRCNVGKALKKTNWADGRPVVNVDHHHSNTRFGAVNWIVEEAGSTCELIHALLIAAGRPVDGPTATLLYAGIQTDTMGFALPTTGVATLRAAADLVARGADITTLGDRLYHCQTRSEFELLRIVYANTRTVADGQIAYSSASWKEIHDAGCLAADIDDQINAVRSLDGVKLAMLFSEGNRGETRINFRSSGSVTVSDLASAFDGGGHRQAAGAILRVGIDEAIDRVVPRAVEHLKRFNV